ncbi:hypothetical protein BVE84_08860 [Streptococcus azizii]|uniref:Pre-toxin TG domain-containing protein n=1 Tax=Streptococcus azizii TaxID=1579424 RepID=A0AB36JNS1_9STRE|nr:MULTISPECIES: RHS repeat-associated core domain-containing protein [Streptococcus]MBF0776545.1 RHS repeat-associated core domain-containing protein [Streptococcus sp. 19428wD3_AN2]ONK26448.1 hypothetical protein BVE86_07185 [Streptococcus azizii]ONK26710.1 hypothetical protein BVE84_08860 [Streptococcus azizii]ONK26974.1 hypothetical protein BVE85_07170 [Streptococcus azizii]
MTGLTKDGQAVASSKYQLYGSTKDSTDETGNPYAYNGEARDSTGLDYLRARYYDSQAGTFLTEDSYSGSRSNPLSQNRYAYVQNNPVNYTDPSGHFRKMLPDGKGPRYTQPKPLINPKDGTLYAPTTPEHEAHQIRQQQTGVYSYTYVPSYVPTSSAYEYIQQQESQLRAQAHAQAVQYRQQQIRQEYAQSIGQYGRPRAREANNLLLNWSKALKDMFTHVCTTADYANTKSKDTKINKKALTTLALLENSNYLALGIYDWLRRNPIGVSNTQTISKMDTKSGLLFSSFADYSSEVTASSNSWLDINITNNSLSGITFNSKSTSFSLGYSEGNLTISSSENYTKHNSISGSVSIGKDGVDVNYVNSFSNGDATIGSGAGVSLKPDLVNGILGMYHTVESSQHSREITTTNKMNVGFKMLNGPQAMGILSLVALLFGNPQPLQQIQQYPLAP